MEVNDLCISMPVFSLNLREVRSSWREQLESKLNDEWIWKGNLAEGICKFKRSELLPYPKVSSSYYFR